MLLVPLKAVPNQQVQTQLNVQACTLNVYQSPYGLFMDVYLGAALIIAGVLCLNLNRIVRSTYLGFSGDFCFYDETGGADPVYTGLGSRYQLVYLESADL